MINRTTHETVEILLGEEYTNLQEKLTDYTESLQLPIDQDNELHDLIDAVVMDAVADVASQLINHFHPDANNDLVEPSRIIAYQVHVGLCNCDLFTWSQSMKFDSSLTDQTV